MFSCGGCTGRLLAGAIRAEAPHSAWSTFSTPLGRNMVFKLLFMLVFTSELFQQKMLMSLMI